MVRPSPVPPKSRAIEMSACAKASKITDCLSRGMPMPVSVTAKSTRQGSCETQRASRRTEPPRGVNLSALPRRFERTSRSRRASPRTEAGRLGSMNAASSTLFWSASTEKRSMVVSSSSRRANGALSISSLPRSRRERSRMSLVMPSSTLALSAPLRTYSACRGSSGVLSSSSRNPMRPFNGVLISWLICARNSVFALSATCAFSSAALSSETSCPTAMNCSSFPPSSRIGITVRSTNARRGGRVRHSTTACHGRRAERPVSSAPYRSSCLRPAISSRA